MFQSLSKKLLLGIGGLIFAGSAFAQAPTDNPYRSYVSRQSLLMPNPHWTDSLSWGRSVNIQDFRNLVRDTLLNNGIERRQNWWYAYEAASEQIRVQGGGVVYFPGLPAKVEEGFEGEDSSYWFHNNLRLKSRVVLRGQTPAAGRDNAKERNFLLPTYFEFPKYQYGLGIGVAGGTPNSTAFKMVVLQTTTTNNTGMVNIDFNRAGVSIYPEFEEKTVGSTSTRWAKPGVRNIIFLTCRNNNVAIPDPGVPGGNIATWHRFPWRFAANYDIFADANVLVVNNRMNDFENNDNRNRVISIDNFQMNNYCAANIPGGTCLSGNQAVFSYTDHYGIIVNRLKKSGPTSVTGFLENSNPDQEPSLFIPGVTVEDNYIFKTSRVGVHAGGLNMSIRRNVIRDDSSKLTYLTPTGTSYNTNSIATFENRGIDMSGWGAQVEDNNIQVYRTILKSVSDDARSADGEGWYSQGPGGSVPKNYIIRNNVTRTSMVGLQNAVTSAIRKGINGIINVNEITNVLVENNDNGCIPMHFNANTSGPGGGQLSNLVVRNNIFTRGITAFGSQGGSQNYVHDNTGCTTPLPLGQVVPSVLEVSCHVSLHRNAAQGTTNTNINLPLQGSCAPVTPTSACFTPYPVARMFRPTRDTSVNAATTPTYRLMGVYYSNQNAGCAPTTVDVFRNTTRIGAAEVDFNDSLYYYDLPINPAFRCDLYHFVFNFDDGTRAVSVMTRGVQICQNTEIQASLENALSAENKVVEIYPNPASQTLNVKLQNFGFGKVFVSDLTGKTLKTLQFNEANSLMETNVSDLANGAYLLRIEGSNGSLVKKFLKQ